MPSPHPLWFIAVLPPEDIGEEVKAFKEYAREHFSSAWSLRSPAHITLFPPFRWVEGRVAALETALENFARQQTEFELELNGFDCFPPRVIFVDVTPSPALQALQKALVLHLDRTVSLEYTDRRNYHPHMTVAFKDLTKSAFHPAWSYFSTLHFERTFPVRDLSLLRHEKGGWRVVRQFGFA